MGLKHDLFMLNVVTYEDKNNRPNKAMPRVIDHPPVVGGGRVKVGKFKLKILTCTIAYRLRRSKYVSIQNLTNVLQK